MSKEDEAGEIIDRCISVAKAHGQYQNQIGYNRYANEKGEDVYFENDDLISAYIVRDELEREIASYLRIKEAEINSKLAQAKCEAYELALTGTRPTTKEPIDKVKLNDLIEKIHEGDEE